MHNKSTPVSSAVLTPSLDCLWGGNMGGPIQTPVTHLSLTLRAARQGLRQLKATSSRHHVSYNRRWHFKFYISLYTMPQSFTPEPTGVWSWVLQHWLVCAADDIHCQSLPQVSYWSWNDRSSHLTSRRLRLCILRMDAVSAPSRLSSHCKLFAGQLTGFYSNSKCATHFFTESCLSDTFFPKAAQSVS